MKKDRTQGGRSSVLVAATIVLVFLVGGIAGVLIDRAIHRSTPSGNRPPGASSSTTGVTSDSSTTSTPTTSSSTTSTIPPQALSVASIQPAAGAKDVAGDVHIVVTLSAPLSKSSPMPTITPPAPGSWLLSGDLLTFVPSIDFTPLSEVTVSLPGGPSGLSGATGGHLARSVTDQFQTADGSVVRIQQLLSLLDYSPLVWVPAGSPVPASDTKAQVAAFYRPPGGNYAWRRRGWPAELKAMWQPGTDNVFTRGLIMSFQADHALIPNGEIAPSLWTALITALASNSRNTGGYDYALADKATPESLVIYHDGAVVVNTPANTGIGASPTPDGTFPVFERLRQQVMRGTNPNGSTLRGSRPVHRVLPRK